MAKNMESALRHCRKLGDVVCFTTVEPRSNDAFSWASHTSPIQNSGKRILSIGALANSSSQLALALLGRANGYSHPLRTCLESSAARKLQNSNKSKTASSSGSSRFTREIFIVLTFNRPHRNSIFLSVDLQAAFRFSIRFLQHELCAHSMSRRAHSRMNSPSSMWWVHIAIAKRVRIYVPPMPDRLDSSPGTIRSLRAVTSPVRLRPPLQIWMRRLLLKLTKALLFDHMQESAETARSSARGMTSQRTMLDSLPTAISFSRNTPYFPPGHRRSLKSYVIHDTDAHKEMARPKARTISRPFDPRHVAGVGIPGATIPISGVQRSLTGLESEDAAAEPRGRPSRANTIANSFSRPSLRLKTSISRLTRSSSNSPDTYLRKRNASKERKENDSPRQMIPKQPPVRPKRADSGTAIDLTDVPKDERPLGFQEIMAVKSFAERMALYKKTRDYWASADHGLEEWVERAGAQRPIVMRV
ncbi:uncharacterized protein BDR25DRAFT_338913 [Lindgomyces ingoldianus]|uniref:Uncharacterized protein n=1 Tax=Lindgomyces ingoldianus TaxID=673940 RepID=A0ACB6RIN3_9PLEO|nr:uncharacterized protein BDR25DRAFT_338913 [Lindgomyces ingoldianus]KAF2478326.1 hypothetical protein BDR25DRAFT_338913 [Lindgomyces ingoldianus]